MAMTFNQFQKELKRRVNDPQLAYMLSYMFEVIATQNKQLDEMAAVLLNVTEQTQRFADLNAQTQEQIKHLKRFGRPDGIEVESVANDPNEVN